MIATDTGRLPVAGVAVVLGTAVAAVDRFAAAGEVSPIVIVSLLTAAAGGLGYARPRYGWMIALLVGAPVPAAHAVVRLLGLPDSLHPNTWRSVGLLALFCPAVCRVASLLGSLARRGLGDASRSLGDD